MTRKRHAIVEELGNLRRGGRADTWQDSLGEHMPTSYNLYTGSNAMISPSKRAQDDEKPPRRCEELGVQSDQEGVVGNWQDSLSVSTCPLPMIYISAKNAMISPSRRAQDNDKDKPQTSCFISVKPRL